MKSSKEIELLIEKYYNGETSLEEEQQLQEFFLGEVVPDHLKTYQQQFGHLAEGGDLTWPDFTEDKLFSKLEASLEEKQAETTKVVEMPRQKPSAELWFYRVAAAVALVLVGYFAGRPGGGDVQVEINELKDMMIAQMDGASASGRMQAVNYSFNMSASEADDEVLDVLMQVVLEDENMNVRMKGVEALTRFGNVPKVRKALVNALGTETEPVVKLALIEALVGLGEVEAVDNLQKIADDENNLTEVRDEALMGIFKLKEM